jgi:quercetin dioxygenase-like cupin family protein
MSSRIAFAIVLALAASVALAQEPTKVEPTHYKLDFENDRVQVVYVHYGPHERSSLHEHPGGVVVVITGGHLRFTDENGKTQEVYAKPGEARWFAPFKHKVENLGDSSYSAVYVGVKRQVSATLKDGQPVPADEMQEVLAALAGRPKD